MFQLGKGITKDDLTLGHCLPGGGGYSCFCCGKVLSDVIAQGLFSLLILLLLSWFCSLELWLVNRS